MSLVSLSGWTPMPRVPQIPLSDSTTTLDATTDYVAWCAKAPASGTISYIYLRIGSTTLAGTMSCQVQTLDSSGDPSGTAYGSCAQSDVTVTGSEDNSWLTFGPLACSVTAGDYVCIKFWASVVTSGSINVVSTPGGSPGEEMGLPYRTIRTTGSGGGTHGAAGVGPAVEYSSGGVSGYYGWGWMPPHAVATENIDADGAIRKLGNRLVLPVPVVAIGAWVLIDNDTDTTLVKLWDTDGATALATATLVSANRNASSGRIQYVIFDGGTEVTLSANTSSPYRIAAETNNTSTTAAGFSVCSAAGFINMMQLGAAACHYTSHNGTSWSDTTTKRAPIGLIVSKIDDGSSQGTLIRTSAAGRW